MNNTVKEQDDIIKQVFDGFNDLGEHSDIWTLESGKFRAWHEREDEEKVFDTKDLAMEYIESIEQEVDEEIKAKAMEEIEDNYKPNTFYL